MALLEMLRGMEGYASENACAAKGVTRYGRV
jgi:hypothetical protein